ncbi:uncharacterized protein L203_100988 [Cryptococcus depauperatus CBS 7841]|uniref:Uncharacterized protein n=1 Tax=Cryptococcus depauperatus CBS 7841 TaxID=1295531 RepID=A0A1E3IBE8_9TREE|nr:hypothetical protein L203_05189 [Cryptococcus depauperatus CBS 7841]
MSLNIAGPSRIPLKPFVSACRRAPVVRLYTTDAQEQPTEQQPQQSLEHTEQEPVESLESMPLDPSPIPKRMNLELRGGRIFFRDWMRVEGEQYRVTVKGQKAKWLGGSVPYASNPTFRPPPPLSNYLQNEVYQELQRGQSVASLATKYNISKARIDAIRKLKEVEDEFRRRSLTLQTAFLEGMESLLGVQIPINPQTKRHDAVLARKADLARETHPSTAVDHLEEQRLEASQRHEKKTGKTQM